MLHAPPVDIARRLLPSRSPLVALLHPHDLWPLLLGAAVIGVAAGGVGYYGLNWPLWGAAAVFLAIMLLPMSFKWRADALRYGATAAGLSVLLTTQGFHTIEHLVQWVQYHLLNWTARASSGILSPANSEWVHFTWNWLVLLGVIWLIKGGWRNGWSWLLLIIALTHTIEHSYTFSRYLQLVRQLEMLGVPDASAQGMPGIVGQGGWLAQSSVTRGTFVCRIPGLTTANRLDIHFWWNALELLPLVFGAHLYMRDLLRFPADDNVNK